MRRRFSSLKSPGGTVGWRLVAALVVGLGVLHPASGHAQAAPGSGLARNVPASALTFGPPVGYLPVGPVTAGPRVWVVRGDSLRPVPVQVGASAGVHTQVRGPLRAGEIVATGAAQPASTTVMSGMTGGSGRRGSRGPFWAAEASSNFTSGAARHYDYTLFLIVLCVRYLPCSPSPC